jgi:hypothetical protein
MTENTPTPTPAPRYGKGKVPADASGQWVWHWDDIAPPEMVAEWVRDDSADEPGGRRAVTDDDGFIVRDEHGHVVYELSLEDDRRLVAAEVPWTPLEINAPDDAHTADGDWDENDTSHYDADGLI